MNEADTAPIGSLLEAIDYFQETLAAHPEADAHAALEAALDGRRRPYPVFRLGYLRSPDDTGRYPPAFPLREVRTDATTVEGCLAREVVNLLAPLDLANPVSPNFGLGQGTGTLVTNFGIPINEDADNTPAFTKELEAVLAEPVPDPLETGLVPAMRERIALLKDHLPPLFKIALPDMQGPYNLVHAIVGEEALTAPYTDPEEFAEFMGRVTDLWLAVRKALVEWIGPEYAAPGDRHARIAECSVNLVSPDLYVEHILPHDRRIAEAWGAVHIHPCSGPHVFEVTWENLPVVGTEAGFVERTAAGAIAVDEALGLLGDAPVHLAIGEELPEGAEEETVRRHFDLYADRPRLTFGYTGMHWRKADVPRIREMHARLDAYFHERYA